jgi:hypothetical protein
MRLERERAGYRNAHSGLGSAGARSLLCSRHEPRPMSRHQGARNGSDPDVGKRVTS